MSITVIATGKKHEPWIAEGLERYQKRLRKPFAVEWVLLPHSIKSGVGAALEESQRIQTRLSGHGLTILLDERGNMLDSPALSARLTGSFEQGQDVTIIIGGAYGVSDQLRRHCDVVWSLSPLVFPHQLVRLILIEQLYRAQSIARGEPYHHE